MRIKKKEIEETFFLSVLIRNYTGPHLFQSVLTVGDFIGARTEDLEVEEAAESNYRK